MPNEAESPQKPPRRSKRSSKPKGPAPSSSQTPSKTQSNGPHDEVSTPLAQAAPTELARESGMLVSAKEHHKSETPIPSTPPRSRSGQPSSSRRDHVASEPMHGATNRADGNRSRHGRQRMPPRTSQADITSAAGRSNTLSPGRANETPSKAYAGPTFHASPAASSLPMPKFFSQSVPNMDKTSSLKNMMGPDAPDSASENEECPFIDGTRPEIDRQVQDRSPLDIFFQADRKAKASAKSFGPTNVASGSPSPFDSLRPEAITSHGSSRNHSRHPTDGSIGGVFDVEIGSPAPQMTDRAPLRAKAPTYDRSISAPSRGTTDEQDREEQRQASTVALKKMLLSPLNQRSEIADTNNGVAAMNLGSPSPKSHQQQTSPAQAQFRPSSSPALASDASRVQRQAALRALAEKQIPSGNGYTSQRALASNLRKELTDSNLPTQHDPPQYINTPTPAPRHSSPPSANTRSQVQNRNRAADNGKILIPDIQKLPLNSKQQREVTPSGPSPTTAAIENDLRRILKIGILGNDGASGVRS